jgi:dynein heavy chain
MIQEVSPGNEVEFTIQARNDLGENRTSGLDQFELEVSFMEPPTEEGARATRVPVECNIEDCNNGKYICRYVPPGANDYEIRIEFQDDKGNMVPLRGSPYKARMVDGFKDADGKMVGEALKKYIGNELKRLQELMSSTKADINTKHKDKDLTSVKQLLNVKEKVEDTQKQQTNIDLQIDQLDESIKLMLEAKKIKEGDQKTYMSINKNWQDVKKLAKDVKKEIQPLVDHEREQNNKNIKTLEEEITFFTQEMRKREFFQYKCGVTIAIEKLGGVFDELKVFEDKIEDYGDNSRKFGAPDMINKAIKDIEAIKINIKAMNELWRHIEICQNAFNGFLGTKWVDTDPGD